MVKREVRLVEVLVGQLRGVCTGFLIFTLSRGVPVYTQPKLIDHGTVVTETMGSIAVVSTKDGGSGLAVYAPSGDHDGINMTTESQTSGETRIN